MTAWMHGHTAQQSGQPTGANPHAPRTDQWWAWRAGWHFLVKTL